nr:hypothetical protein [Tanacetum cinerariifolium]
DKPNHTNAETEFFIDNERGVMISAKEDSLCAALKTDTVKPLNFLVEKVNHPDVTLIDLQETRRVSTVSTKKLMKARYMPKPKTHDVGKLDKDETRL